MAKPKLNTENMWKNDAAKSIMALLFLANEGLEPKHLRFILEENYATPEQIANDPQVANNVKKLENFFKKHKEEIDVMIKTGMIVKGCIKSRSHLNYYLHKLKSKNLKVINEKSEIINHKYVKNYKTKYFLTDTFIGEMVKRKHMEAIIRYDNNYIFDLSPIKPVSFNSKIYTYYHVFYGISRDILRLPSEKRKKAKEKMLLISKSLEEIEELFSDFISPDGIAYGYYRSLIHIPTNLIKYESKKS